MESIIRDVTSLDDTHRRALEDVIGRELQSSQRLIISVLDAEVPPAAAAKGPRPPQSLADWANVYEGLSDDQIDQIDQIATTRATLSRHLP
jgi:hypothetical protein